MAVDEDYNSQIEEVRSIEYPFVRDAIYLDHAGATLHCRRLLDRFHADMISTVYGNPHSASRSSQQSTEEIENVRVQALEYFGFDPDKVDLVFTANTTAAVKLVVEAFREHPDGFWYGYHVDAHTSLVGVRETATQTHCFESDAAVEAWLGERTGHTSSDRNRLFAYPAQSNMNGRRLPLTWVSQCVSSGGDGKSFTLLDAASFAATSRFHFESVESVPHFTVLSFTKVFGFPDLGALIVRKDAAHVFAHRKYFGGGTVDMVVCLQEEWHAKKSGPLHVRLEDGTLPVHNILALKSAMQCHGELFRDLHHIAQHTADLARELYAGLASLKHSNNQPVCRIYKHGRSQYGELQSQGPIVAFNLRDRDGNFISNSEVEKLANIQNVHLRTGGLCNPGGIAISLDLAPWEMRENFSAGFRCGADEDVLNGKPTGMIRVSLGAPSTRSDVTRFLEFIDEFFVDHEEPSAQHVEPCASLSDDTASFQIESLTIYPIKSCAGWQVPYGMPWDVHREGLAWDREWCIVKKSSGTVLSMKNHPRMALIRPQFDFKAGVLRISITGDLEHVNIPLSKDPSVVQPLYYRERDAFVCGDAIKAWQYKSPLVAAFFTRAIGLPCTMARFPAATDACSFPTARHSKPHLQVASLPQPLLLSNESPILSIFRSSLNSLNGTIESQGGKAVHPSIFRANIILSEISTLLPRRESPWAEDTWRHMRVGGVRSQGPVFDFLGGCRRCQMLCIDQESGEKNREPFVTLAKTRRIDGKILFGVHTALGAVSTPGVAMIKSGDLVEAWK